VKTAYIAAYDLENEVLSPAALEVIADVHARHDVPATFFVVGRLLEVNPGKYEVLRDEELFDVESHTYSHGLLKNSVVHGEGVSLDVVETEVARAGELLSSTFNREIIGLRTPCGFYRGLQGRKDVLEVLWRNGIRFVSSDLRGRLDTLPAPFTQPYWYKEDGFPQLLELPGHDWHDNVLKGYGAVPAFWPPIFPWGLPRNPPETPEEEFEKVYRHSIDYAIEQDLTYYSPIMHPWSIYRFNKEAKTIDLILSHAKKRGMEFLTYRRMYERLIPS
jgi:peptidoglycan/xylan/chitin deacetylase (PgdA/CDA1 family)